MQPYIEWKMRGDAFDNRFSCGLTMCGSESTKRLRETEATEAAETCYTDDRGHNFKLKKQVQKEAVLYSVQCINASENPVTLEMLSSFAFSGLPCDKVHRLQTFWSAEGKLLTQSLTDLHLDSSWSGYGLRTEKFGAVGSMPVRKFFPFLALENSSTQEFLAIQLYAPCSWQMEISVFDDTVTVCGGMADYEFGHWCKTLAPGEMLEAPKAAVATGKSLPEVCAKLVEAQQADYSDIDADMPIAFNEFCTTWGVPSYEKIVRIANILKNRGVRYFVIDAGWYANENGWELSAGDWEPNRQLFPNGLKAAADYIRDCGMIPGIWFELEVVGRTSKAFYNTEHLLKRHGMPITTGDRRFWDMRDHWVQNYLTQKVIGLLQECNFGYLKIDYNDTIGVGCDNAESLGEGLRKTVTASQMFFKKIKQTLPHLVIELCSSGGHRLEPSFLQLVSQASFSDAHETTAIPIIAANLQRIAPARQLQIWAVLRKTDSLKRLRYSLVNTFLGRMCLSGDVDDLTTAQWEIVEDSIRFYSRISHIIAAGRTIIYNTTADNYTAPTGAQLVLRETKEEALLILYHFALSESNGIPEAFDSANYLKNHTVLSTFGLLEGAFSAQAWHLKKNTP